MSSDDNPQLVIVRQDVIHVHEVPDKRKQVSRVEEPTNKWCWTRMQEVCRKNDKKCSYKCWSEVIQILCDSCKCLDN